MIDTDPKIHEELRNIAKKRGGGDFNNTLPIAKIDIPDSVIIRCPMVGGENISATNCATCRHFYAVVQTTYDDKKEIRWDRKYAIACTYHVERKCSMIATLKADS